MQRLEFFDSTIRYRVDGDVVWELPLESVRVIGEMTTDAGPAIDDYFFCFSDAPTRWYEASFYADGRKEFLEELEAFLGARIALKLLGSTDFASNILWPPSAAGRPMFEFRPVEVGVFARLVGLERNRQFFSSDALAELGRNA